jgi:signal transduction histidine kinase
MSISSPDDARPVPVPVPGINSGAETPDDFVDLRAPQPDAAASRTEMDSDLVRMRCSHHSRANRAGHNTVTECTSGATALQSDSTALDVRENPSRPEFLNVCGLCCTIWDTHVKLDMVDTIRDLWVLNGGKYQVRFRVLIIAIAMVGISLLHYLTPISMLHWHNLFQHLHYLPIIFAALSFGWRGGLLTAVMAGVSQVPHIIATWGVALNYSEDLIWEIPAFCAAGVLAGIAAERERAQQKALEHTTAQLTQVYKELQNNFEKMKRAERLYAVGQLSAGLAHELRNPLASIAGAAGILKRNPDARERRAECLGIIDKECERLNRLLTQFLDFARPRAPHYQDVDPAAALDSVIDLASHATGRKQIVLRKEVAPDAPVLACDPEQLKQVLLNLVINAIQATGERGEVVLSASGQNGKTLIQVTDEGCGIRPEDLDKIFDPFFTTKENGTGLGLSVVHQIVEQHGGVLTAEKNRDKGMTFSILFPARQDRTG